MFFPKPLVIIHTGLPVFQFGFSVTGTKYTLKIYSEIGIKKALDEISDIWPKMDQYLIKYKKKWERAVRKE
jgi:hypothetical protein